jgi:hypothetical protein
MRARAWLLAGCCGLATAGAAAAEPIEVRATAVPFDARTMPGDTPLLRVGRLTYRGGVQLTSPAPMFGGLSALNVTPDGTGLVAVSDQGQWLRARLVYDGAGDLVDVTQAEMGPLGDTRGAPLAGKVNQDAEALTRLPEGSWVVAFERRQRLWRYPPGPAPEGAAEVLAVPRELLRAPENGGVEALATLLDGRLVAICEELLAGGRLRGFVREGRRWRAFTYPIHGLLRPSGATVLPSGDLLVLERGYSPDAGVTLRMRRVRAREVRRNAALEGEVLAQIQPPLTVDNFEGISARRAPSGETLVYLLSDDNFSPDQRTLLLMFALDEPADAASHSPAASASPAAAGSRR